MKHKNSQNEIFFKNLASSYTEKSGEELKKEIAYINLHHPSETLSLDKKVKSRIMANKIKKWTSVLTPVAACFIILFIALNIFRLPVYYNSGSNKSDNNMSEENIIQNTPSEKSDFEFISSKLPSEYTLKKIDYDHQKTIYYIIGNNDAEIILTVEEFKGNINPDGLEQMRINDINAYGISTEDFSFIQYKKDDLLYMLTCPDDYDDLIKISEYLI